MSKVEDYTARATASLAAAEAATNARDRAFHQRAYSIWRKLIAGVAAAEERAVMSPPRPRSGDARPISGKLARQVISGTSKNRAQT